MEHLSKKFCPKCKETLPIENFYFYAKLSRYDSWCRMCINENSRVYSKTHYTIDRGRAASYKRRYGITFEQYEDMFAEQGGVCAACGKPEKKFSNKSKQITRLHVDHCHKTGRVRGLLCNDCNTAL